MHIFSENNEKCIFCGNEFNLNDAINPFYNSTASINERLFQIDKCISESHYDNALSFIDEVMELAPGPEVGEIVPKSGEIYWRKLLANSKCKNDLELICKGRLLHNNELYKAAVRYASEFEEPVYEWLKKTEDIIVNILEKALSRYSSFYISAKATKKSLEDYKQELSAAEKIAQENIRRLEEIEKSIHEQIIDCAAIIGEYKHTLNNIFVNAKTIGDATRDEITLEEKVNWKKQLTSVLAESNAEIKQLKEIKNSHPVFYKYSRLLNEQKSIIYEVNKNIDDIKGIRIKIKTLVSSIEKIAEDYDKALDSLHNGSYKPAINLITQENFDKIVKQAFKGV
jgi:hypothetical protein